MLDGLDDIPWETLTGAYGPATKVPQQIRTLLSPNANARLQAYGDLENTLFHQGGLYPAAAPSVRFLLEVMNSPDAPEPLIVLELLTLLSEVVSPLDVRADLSHFKRQKSGESLIQHFLQSVDELRSELAKGVAPVTRILNGPQKDYHASCATFLANLVETPEAIGPLLNAIEHADISVRAIAADAVAEKEDVSLNTLAGIFTQSTCPLVRCFVALRLAIDGNEKQRTRAATFLHDQLAAPDPAIADIYRQVDRRNLRSQIFLVLFRSKSSLLDSALSLRLKQMVEFKETNDLAENDAILQCLQATDPSLANHWGTKPLTPRQLEILTVLRRRAWDTILGKPAEFPQTVELFAKYGLPNTPKAFDRLLRQNA